MNVIHSVTFFNGNSNVITFTLTACSIIVSILLYLSLAFFSLPYAVEKPQFFFLVCFGFDRHFFVSFFLFSNLKVTAIFICCMLGFVFIWPPKSPSVLVLLVFLPNFKIFTFFLSSALLWYTPSTFGATYFVCTKCKYMTKQMYDKKNTNETRNVNAAKSENQLPKFN